MIDCASKKYIRKAQEKPWPGWFVTASVAAGIVIGIGIVIAEFLA